MKFDDEDVFVGMIFIFLVTVVLIMYGIIEL